MTTRLCPICGSSVPSDSLYCPACGRRIPARWRYRFAGTYPFPRFQIDPAEPSPARDLRWPTLVVGVSLLIVGGILLTVDAIVDAAAACGTPASSTPCVGVLFTYLFLIPGLALLAVGAALIVVVVIDLLR